MILFITSTFDPHVDYLIDHIKGDFFRFNTDDFLSYHQIDVELSSYSMTSKVINRTGSSLNLDTPVSIYYRRPTIPTVINNIKTQDTRQLILDETKEFLRQLYNSLPHSKWLGTPWDIEFSSGRLHQLSYASKLGFKIPKTLFTSSKDKFFEFYYKCNQKVVIKPINSGSSVKREATHEPIYTEVINCENINSINFDLLGNAPCLFQEFIDGEYELRITSVGNNHFPVKIISRVTDWRKEEAFPQYSIYTLPTKIGDLCSKFLEGFNLNFGCFDLIRGKDGEYYFLELNPNGQWLWLELETKLPICRAILDHLGDGRQEA